MILLEGPDGSGKTTLLKELLNEHGDTLEQRPRFSTPEGPLSNLYVRVYNDLQDMRRSPVCGVYDRHPLVSEYVYGQAMPDREVNPDFLWPSAAEMLRDFASRTLLVMCLPPLAEVHKNLEDERVQMDGVRENVFRMYQAYQVLSLWWPNQRSLVTYDYTSNLSVAHTRAAVRLHLAEWSKNHG